MKTHQDRQFHPKSQVHSIQKAVTEKDPPNSIQKSSSIHSPPIKNPQIEDKRDHARTDTRNSNDIAPILDLNAVEEIDRMIKARSKESLKEPNLNSNENSNMSKCIEKKTNVNKVNESLQSVSQKTKSDTKSSSRRKENSNIKEKNSANKNESISVHNLPNTEKASNKRTRKPSLQNEGKASTGSQHNSDTGDNISSNQPKTKTANKTHDDNSATSDQISPYSPFHGLDGPIRSKYASHNKIYDKSSKSKSKRDEGNKSSTSHSRKTDKSNSVKQKERNGTDALVDKAVVLDSSSDAETPEIQLSAMYNDVLLSKDDFFSFHPGNKNFRKYVERSLLRMSVVDHESMRSAAEKIIEKVKNKTGLFLLRLETGNGWKVMDEETCLSRVQQFMVKERSDKGSVII